MMKYKVGDKVILEAEVQNTVDDVLILKFADGHTDRCIEGFVLASTDAYNKGLQDAWKLYMMCLEMPRNEFCKILGIEICTLGELFESIEPQEALAKIEAYEKSQQIQVGDVVECIHNKNEFLVITKEDDESVYDYGAINLISMTVDRITGDLSKFKKTGKHIDIESLLEQIN